MTKMEDEEMSGGESQADVPTSNQNRTPSSESGEGGAQYCEQYSTETKSEDCEPTILCSGCNQPILDKFYMNVDGRSWHEKCVNCGNCGRSLSDSCFSKNFKLFCKDCYQQSQYCHRCSGSISGDELVMRVGGDAYHVSCFLCDYCRRQLQVGDKFHSLHETTSRKICCKTCYDMDDVSDLRVTETDSEDSISERDEFSPGLFPPPPDTPFMKSQHPPFGRQLSDFNPGPPPPHLQAVGVANTSLMTSSDPKRTKRPRTILTTAQRKKFKASFEISQKPCRKVRETLASETGLTPRVVQVWFQNQRAKVKKMARRQSQGDASTRRGRRRKDDNSDSENEDPSSPGSYTSASTPHQTSYSDYQSPGSVQSTTTQDDNARMFSPSFNPYDQRFDGPSRGPVEGAFYPPSATPHSPTHLEMHQMLHERVGVQHDLLQPRGDPLPRRGENIESYATSREPEIVDLSQRRPLGGDTCGGSTNPIDSLMYMQNSFFSTS